MEDWVDDDLIREVYARFGLAYYLSECLHRSLCILLAFSELPSGELITRPRAEERLAHGFSLTLGDVVVKLEGALPTALVEELRQAVKARNFLAHHFWWERIHLMFRREYVRQLVVELDGYADLFNRLDTLVSERLERKRWELGVTDEALKDSMNRLLAGDLDEPLPDRLTVKELERRLSKRQRLIRVWEFTLEDGQKPLIFELADGSLWQLSDVGLAWSVFQQVGANWVEHPSVKPYLPADILPRPKVAGPWDYEFTLANGAILWVKPGRQKGTFRWGVRIPKASP